MAAYRVYRKTGWDKLPGISPRSQVDCSRILSWLQLINGLVMLLYSEELGLK